MERSPRGVRSEGGWRQCEPSDVLRGGRKGMKTAIDVGDTGGGFTRCKPCSVAELGELGGVLR